MFDRRLITNFNWPLLLMGLVLSCIGLVNLYSATSSFDPGTQGSFFKAQLIWTLIGLGTLLFSTSIHYRFFSSISSILYWGSIILLICVLVFGSQVSGHQSWLQIGSIKLQPAEITKLTFIMMLSKHLSRWEAQKKGGLKDLLPSLFLFIIPFILVVLQGDLGSSLFFGLIYVSLILIQGVKLRIIVSLTIFGTILVIVSYFFFLSPYQKNRIQTFLNPELDRRGSGYHLIQSKIAVGSGGVLGKGFLKGENHKLKFIPERHTDFIFPVLAEEWGFVGSFALMISYLVFISLGLQVALRSPERYGFFLSVGVCALFFWHLVVNLGGVLGLIPLTGVPLPFLSYGGSAMLTNWLGVGLLLNISMRRFMFT